MTDHAFTQQIAAANQRRREAERDRELAWLEAATQIIRDASAELEADLDLYDQRVRLRREATDYELDCAERARDMKEAQR